MEDDILAAVQAAATQMDSGDAAPAQEAPQAAPEPAAAAAQPASDGAPTRDASGRFAKAEISDNTPPIEVATPAANAEPQTEAIRVPASLPAPLKAKFKELPEDWRNALLSLEDGTKAAKDEWGKKAERLNRLEEVFAPRREKFQLQGLDEVVAVQTLFAAQDLLERSPLEGLSYLARSYGVDLRQLAGQTSGQPQQGQPAGMDLTQHPALAPLFQQVQTLQQQAQQREQQEVQRVTAEAQAKVAAFEADPKNLYFENVRGQVGQLLASGVAQTLEQAYDMAVWADPQIRALIQQEQASEAAKAAAIAAATKAQQAKMASGSVTGAPAGAVAQGARSSGDIMEDVRAAASQISARVG